MKASRPPKAPMREKVPTRSVFLRSEANVAFLNSLIAKLPLDYEHPVEIVIREEIKKRKDVLNQAMWAGPLQDIEAQAHHPHPDGPLYPAKVWHEALKERFLPDENLPDFDPSHVLDGYEKWEIDPFNGQRRLKGSTTQLTDRGMKVYLLKMEAYMATEYEVVFTAPEDERA